MKIVVTGSSGYVGAALLDRLAAMPEHHVIGVDRVPPKSHGSQVRFDFVQCDLADPGRSLEAARFSGVDAVVHLAAARGDWALSASDYWRDNVDTTRQLLAASWAPSVPMWVFMSSVSTYGPAETPLAEDAICRPIGPYGESKLESERLFFDFIARHASRGCAIRPSAIFSPGHPPNTNVFRLIERLRRAPVPLINGGVNRKTLTYLDNLLDLVFWCLDKMQRGELDRSVYNYVEEPVPSVAGLIDVLRGAGIRPARTISFPLGLARAAAFPFYALGRLARVDLGITPERVQKYASSTWYDSSKVRREGFQPRVGLDEALHATARWHIEHGPRP